MLLDDIYDFLAGCCRVPSDSICCCCVIGKKNEWHFLRPHIQHARRTYCAIAARSHHPLLLTRTYTKCILNIPARDSFPAGRILRRSLGFRCRKHPNTIYAHMCQFDGALRIRVIYFTGLWSWTHSYSYDYAPRINAFAGLACLQTNKRMILDLILEMAGSEIEDIRGREVRWFVFVFCWSALFSLDFSLDQERMGMEDVWLVNWMSIYILVVWFQIQNRGYANTRE